MATRKSIIIPPFPNHVDRDYFGPWLSGLVDGEGHFGIAFVKGYGTDHGLKKTYRLRIDSTPCAYFAVVLRMDDRQILETIQSYFMAGNINNRKPDLKVSHNSNPTAVYRVNKIFHLVSAIIPHFEKYPLLAKKQRDFEIWKEAVRFMDRVRKSGRKGKGFRPDQKRWWNDLALAKFQEYVDALTQIRQYHLNPTINGHPIPVIEPYRPTTSQGLLFD